MQVDALAGLGAIAVQQVVVAGQSRTSVAQPERHDVKHAARQVYF